MHIALFISSRGYPEYNSPVARVANKNSVQRGRGICNVIYKGTNNGFADIYVPIIVFDNIHMILFQKVIYHCIRLIGEHIHTADGMSPIIAPATSIMAAALNLFLLSPCRGFICCLPEIKGSGVLILFTTELDLNTEEFGQIDSKIDIRIAGRVRDI